jgi:hypothetical protein
MSTLIRQYSGKLYYLDSAEYLDISALIVRDAEISFAMVSVIDDGRWEAASGTIAKAQPDGTYVAHGVTLSNGVHSESWDIRLRIDYEGANQPIELSGDISRGALSYKFSGELEPITV